MGCSERECSDRKQEKFLSKRDAKHVGGVPIPAGLIFVMQRACPAFFLRGQLPTCCKLTTAISRFRKVQDYSSSSRVVKCQRTPGGKATAAKNQRIGNPYLKRAYGQMAIYAVRASERIEKLYSELERKYGTQRARARLRHKLAVAVYLMLKNNQAFDEERFVGLSR